MENSQSWDDLTVTFPVDSQSDCRALINMLNESHITTFKLVAAFQEEYQLMEFDKEWKLQTHGPQAEDDSQKRVSRKRLLKRPQNYPVQTVMELGKGMMRAQIFMQTFAQQIQTMQYEYNYRIFCEHSNLWIFMKDSTVLNSLCRVKLMQMKSSLNIYPSNNHDLMVSVKSSPKLRGKLQELGIRSWLRYFGGVLWGIFSSTTLKNNFEIKDKIQEVVKYDIAILNFNNLTSLKLSEAQCMFAVLKDSLSQELTKIQEFFEVDIECNDQQQCIVIHHRHSSFKAGPFAALTEQLRNRLILSVKIRQIKAFDNRVRKMLKEMPFLKQKMNGRRNETFLCLDLRYFRESAEPALKKYLKDLLQLFASIAEKDLELKLYFTHLANFKQAINSTIEVAEDNHFNIVNLEQLVEFKQLKMILRLKDFSEAVAQKRQKQILQLLETLVLQDSQKQVSVVESFSNENSINSEFSSSFRSLQQSSLVIDDKYKAKWLKINFEMPPIKDYGEEIRAYVKDRKNLALQKLFNSQGNAKFKIWSLQLSASLRLPKQVQSEPLLLKKPFEGKDLNQKYEICTLQSFKIKEEGAIVFMNKQLRGDFIPVYLFERIA